MIYPWGFTMILCSIFSFFQFSVNYLMLFYIFRTKKHPKLLLPWLFFTMPFLAVVIMDLTDTMAMDMDMARGQLRPPLDTTDIMDIMDTTDTMAMDMVDMDTMVRKERYLTVFPVCLTSRI